MIRSRVSAVASVLVLLGSATAALASPAGASTSPDPGGGGSGVECAARPSISKSAGIITVQALMTCQHHHNVLEIEVYVGGAPTKYADLDHVCTAVTQITSCSKKWTFTDPAGTQHYSLSMGNSTHWADAADDTTVPHGCIRTNVPGTITCYSASASY